MAIKKTNPLYGTGTSVGTISGGNIIGTVQEKPKVQPTLMTQTTPVQTPVQTPIVNTPQNSGQNQQNSSTIGSTVKNDINTKTPTTTASKQPILPVLPEFDLAEAQATEARLASGQIQTVGQKTPEQKASEEQKVLENTQPTTAKVVEDLNKTITDADTRIQEQENILDTSQENVTQTAEDIETVRQAINTKRETLKLEEDALYLSENNATLAKLQRDMLAELAKAGLSTGDTASMNADLRQKYNAYLASVAVIETVNASIRGNISESRSVVNDYYTQNGGLLQDKLNNYQSLLNSSAGELNRVTGIKKEAVTQKIAALQYQIEQEQLKQSNYNAILQSKAYKNAVRDYGLNVTDDVNTQISKIKQAEQDYDNITELIKKYPDANIKYTDTSSEIFEKLQNSKTYQAGIDKLESDNIDKRATVIAKQLAGSSGYTYTDELDAYSDAKQIALLEQNGVDTETAIKMVTGTTAKSANQVTSQLYDITSQVVTKRGLKVADATNLENRLNAKIQAGNYTGYTNDLLNEAFQSMSVADQSSINTNKYLEESVVSIQPKLNELYKLTNGGSGVMLKMTENGLELFGMGLENEGQAKVAEINKELKRILQTYTKLQSGVAFSSEEIARYEAVLPDIKNGQTLNNATINAIKNQAAVVKHSLFTNVITSSDYATLLQIQDSNNNFNINNFIF